MIYIKNNPKIERLLKRIYSKRDKQYSLFTLIPYEMLKFKMLDIEINNLITQLEKLTNISYDKMCILQEPTSKWIKFYD